MVDAQWSQSAEVTQQKILIWKTYDAEQTHIQKSNELARARLHFYIRYSYLSLSVSFVLLIAQILSYMFL